jgi:hypothetical protein
MTKYKIGIKIVNYYPNKDLITRALEYFKVNKELFLELGLYFSSNLLDVVFFGYAMNEYRRINFHANHKKPVLSVINNSAGIIEDLKIAKSLSSKYSVIHLSENQEYENKFSKKKLLTKSTENLEELNQIAIDNNYHFYLENTFQNVEFYQELFEKVVAKNLYNIHFCFDIGHAKVWSNESVSNWFSFLDNLVSNEKKIHFHLHLNNGENDDHLSFPEFENDYSDQFSEGETYETIFGEIMKKYPDFRKIFEVKTDMIFKNLLYVQDHILPKITKPKKENTRTHIY